MNRLRRWWIRQSFVCASCHAPIWPWSVRHAIYHMECKHRLDWYWGKATAHPVKCWSCQP